MGERRLRNSAAPHVAVVESADELIAAVDAGTTNIEIRQHLDLRVGDADIDFDDYGTRMPVLDSISSVRTIRVRALVNACMHLPPATFVQLQ